MNKHNILALADFIERLPDGKFDMRSCTDGKYDPETDHFCGSPSCIAGWAAWENQGRPAFIIDNRKQWTSGENNLINSALAYFGIEDEGQKITVMNQLFRGDYGDFDNKHLTKADAVNALRTYSATSKIEWPKRPDEEAE